ncbi:MAG: hypothetical protein RR598_00770 [Anaerorhabdus sp.]|uniref:hypothetical protein n=1 Tax=Anaerorhabdus sp. TaxID=1872524 RepID=UPI002B1F8A8B|nr:hypothetical protein [Anaerorhabdus sp.]MEA4874009.1 hypothetical protein [Anaerorhabdus sp.]
MNEIQDLLIKYSKQFECDFFLYDESFNCIAYTRERMQFRNDNQDKEAVVSFQVGKHDFHIVTDEKENRDYLMVVAIACKNKLEKKREELSIEELIAEAIQDTLTDDEFKRCDQYLFEDIYQLYIIKPKHNQERFDDMKEIFFIDDELVVTMDDKTIVLANQMQPSEIYANNLINDFKKYNFDCSIVFGETILSAKELHQGVKELMNVFSLGQVFYEEKNVLSSNDLGVSYLVSKLSQNDIRKISDMWTKNNYQLIIDSDIEFVTAFLRCNLSVSVTANELMITDREVENSIKVIQEKIGLNVLNFEDAMKMALLIMMKKRIQE